MRTAVEELPPTTRPKPSLIEAPKDVFDAAQGYPAAETAAKADVMPVVLAAFAGLGYALSARAILLLTLLGAFVLAVLAMMQPTDLRLWALVIYGVLAVLPVAALEAFKRR